MYDAVGAGCEPACTNRPVRTRPYEPARALNDTMRSRSGCVFEPDLRLIVCAIEEAGAGVLGLDCRVIFQVNESGFEVALAGQILLLRQ